MGNVTARVLLFAMLPEKYGVSELEANCDGTVRNLIDNRAKALNEAFLDDVYDVG